MAPLPASKPDTDALSWVHHFEKYDRVLDEPAVQRKLPLCIIFCIASAAIWTWSIGLIPSFSKDLRMSVLNSTVPTALHLEQKHKRGGKASGLASSQTGSGELIYGNTAGGGGGGGEALEVKKLAPSWSAFLVDCGSGKVAVYEYGTDANGQPAEMGKTSAKMQVADLLVRQTSEGTDVLAPLWQLLDAKVLDSPASAKGGKRLPPLFVGATAGLREQLMQGHLTLADVASFGDALAQRYGDGDRAVKLELLSEQREAALELAAVRYAYEDSDFEGKKAGGSLSGGGKSCQVVWGGGQRDEFMSLDLDLFAAQRVMGAVGEAQALVWWENHIRGEVLKGTGDTGAGAGEAAGESVYVGITMLASAAVQAEVAGRLVSR
mmetsp:Transcript_107415/g.312349  ORF Transcript_107415/g.312349 Transcript_107415/m.312349 type:complete len:378 (-) Transcript_107415:435-1568(-)